MAAHGWAAHVQALTALLALLAATSGKSAEQLSTDAQSGREKPLRPQIVVPDALRSDASLNDVCFVDPQHGWAVGDRGTIWYTENGGRDWVLQESGVACCLESVSFVSPLVGWAAGWVSHPYLHSGNGVLLWTQDGGQTWNHDPRLHLPALKKIRFFSPRSGAALGAPSALYPSGLLTTDSGGRGWNPVVGDRTPGWLAGDFLGVQAGAAAGRRQSLGILRPNGAHGAESPEFGPRQALRIRLTPPNGGWLIGEGGLVLRTTDLGAQWHVPPAIPDPSLQFDLSAIEVRGSRCWIAGNPGTRVFRTEDAGQSWSSAPTGQSVPLNALAFVDEQHGWAVGQLGTILATGDGGITWRRQRAGGTRAALLGIFTQPESIPFELLARWSGNEGYLAAVELIARRQSMVAPRDEVALEDRAREALTSLGAASPHSAWQFPLQPQGLTLETRHVVERWDRLHEGRSLDVLETHLARQIRVWRPEVIVTEEAPPGPSGLGSLLNQAVLRAVAMAADPAALPAQFDSLGLEAWPARRVYRALPPGLPGDTDLNASQLADRFGRTIGDLASQAARLVEDQYHARSETIGFQTMYDDSPRAGDHRDFFAGITLAPGRDARRAAIEPATQSVQLLKRLAQKRRLMQAIIEQRKSDAQASARLLAEIGSLTTELDPDSSAELLFQLAQAYAAQGDWPLAAETYSVLIERFPNHALARPILVWLVQYYGSAEAGWRVARCPTPAVMPASTFPLAARSQSERLARANALGQLLHRVRPDLTAYPAVSFPLSAVERQRGDPRQAARWFGPFRAGIARDAWWACARGEEWLAERRGRPETTGPLRGGAGAAAPRRPLG